MIWCEHLSHLQDVVDNLGNNSVDKRGAEARSVFVSPYLRRPIRPLDKVLNERGQSAVDLDRVQPANDAGSSEERVEQSYWLDNIKRTFFPK